VHQMRVAVRRARSAISLFRPAFAAQALVPLQAPLKILNGQLGAVRDWDVFTGETLPAVQEALPQDERLRRLVSAAGRRRQTLHKALAGWLKDPSFHLLTIHLAWCIASDTWHVLAAPEDIAEPLAEPLAEDGQPEPPPEEPASELGGFASAMLPRRWKRLVTA